MNKTPHSLLTQNFNKQNLVKEKKDFGKTQAKAGPTTKQNDKPAKESKPGNAA